MKPTKKLLLILILVFFTTLSFSENKTSTIIIQDIVGNDATTISVGKMFMVSFDTAVKIKNPYLYVNDMKLAELKNKNFDSNKYYFEVSKLSETKDSVLLEFYNSSSIEDLKLPLKIKDSKNDNITYDCGYLVNPRVVQKWLILIVGLLVIILFVYFVVLKGGKLLRDQGTNLQRPPFSLSRTQMAFWTLIIVISYFIIWWNTGESLSISAEVLALMGISSGTTAIGHLIDSDDITNPRIVKRHQATISNSGFLSNIISDANGYSIHRLQNVVFTIAIGAYFLFEVWDTNKMPDINGNLIVLMGISSGTYLAVKRGENKTHQDTPVG
ncbi:MAG: hypothetical protein JEZ09_08795 [Salinivirgaceae bacterium]|nr:hypothetical protein [Salinivirgaceae bacterium]